MNIQSHKLITQCKVFTWFTSRREATSTGTVFILYLETGVNTVPLRTHLQPQISLGNSMHTVGSTSLRSISSLQCLLNKIIPFSLSHSVPADYYNDAQNPTTSYSKR